MQQVFVFRRDARDVGGKRITEVGVLNPLDAALGDRRDAADECDDCTFLPSGAVSSTIQPVFIR